MLWIWVGQIKYILDDPMDDFVSLKIKIISKQNSKKWARSSYSQHRNNAKCQHQELKENYKKTFIKGSEKSPACLFCNYYYKTRCTSLDCILWKGNNTIMLLRFLRSKSRDLNDYFPPKHLFVIYLGELTNYEN
jgi:TorA maturation chaperone TorD